MKKLIGKKFYCETLEWIEKKFYCKTLEWIEKKFLYETLEWIGILLIFLIIIVGFYFLYR